MLLLWSKLEAPRCAYGERSNMVGNCPIRHMLDSQVEQWGEFSEGQ